MITGPGNYLYIPDAEARIPVRIYSIRVVLYLLFTSPAVLSAAAAGERDKIRVLAGFGFHVDIDFYSPAGRSTSLKHLKKTIGRGGGVGWG